MTSSKKFAVPFRVSIKPSILLNGAFIVMSLGGLAWLWAYDIPVVFKWLVSGVISVAMVIHLRRYLFRTCKRAVSRLVWRAQGEWLLETVRGDTVTARLLGSSFVSPWLIVLNFRPHRGGRMWPVVIVPDSVDSTSFRRLSAKLKMYAAGDLA